ncbi:hypothetical protein [Cohnella luojiensis]|uniref:Uncharacterized protein n=1 Tax=Cohnella luojiensis TaxID=652876 RepID=A0A4Y8M9P0_9BACL|nr:hypothetical protein [Cohnella luojiensis]TFE30004.1 hypothetical protein E2980_04415 [Cohnella luojiensis]
MSMSISVAEKEYADLLQEQIRGASGMRLEKLREQSEGERMLLVDIFWPVRRSFKGITLEKEITTLSGVKAYVDAVDESFRFGLEAEGYVSHAENITRPRFDFEKQRVRSMGALQLRFVPFSYDEMNKKPDMCRRALYELYGRYGGNAGSDNYQKLNLYEREIIRYAIWLNRPIRMADLRECLGKSNDFSTKMIKRMVDKRLLHPTNADRQRHHEYVLDKDASKYLW